MGKSWFGLAAVAGLAMVVFTAGGLVGSAQAADKANQITGVVSLREDRIGGNLIYLHALSGSLADPGLIFRLGAAYGDSEVSDESYSVEFLPGYQFVAGTWKVRALAGLTFVETGAGGVLGAKALLQAQSRKAGELYVSANAGFDTAKMQAQAGLQVGLPVMDAFVGPEVGVIVAEDFVRSRLGVVLTGVKLGEVGMTFRGGFSDYEGSGAGQDSPYLGMSATLQY